MKAIHRKPSRRGAFAILLLGLLGGCSDPKDADFEETDILATVGEQVITFDEVSAQIEDSGGNLDPEDVLNRLIRKHALIDSALNAGLDESDAVIEAWQNAMIRELRRTELDPELAALEPAERDLRALYEREYDRFQQVERRSLAVVQLPDEAAAESFLAEWKNAGVAIEEGFGKLAFQHSTHDRSRYRGGRLGWLSANARPPGVPPELVKAGFALTDPGGISPPVRTAGGWGVVRLLEVEPATSKGFEAVRATLRNEVNRELRRATEEQFYQRIEARAGVRRKNQERLETLKRNEAPRGFGRD